MQGLWMTSALMAGALLEELLGTGGVLLPLTAMVAFYFFVLRCWRHALLLAWVIGTMVDMSFGRSFPYYLVLMPLVLLVARVWKGYQMTHLYVAQILPGIVIGGVTGLFASVTSLLKLEENTPFPFFSFLLLTLKCMGLTAFVLPLLVWLLESCTKVLGLRRFTRVGAEYLLASKAEKDEVDSDAFN